ncbi:MAG: tRNA (guanosine(46)-N7)-methyltransferase TrmB [Bowdeniella nasicola]|nr:tRNA (guanosine(46)-N7)-methyltransferase TrmB [Bowdeniella nasicola]
MTGRQRHRIPSFVRRGMRMTRAQAKAWQRLNHRYVLPLARGAGATEVAAIHRLDLAACFPTLPADAPTIVEIGTGTGDQLIHAATTNRDTRFLGAEVWRPGIAHAMMGAHDAQLDNVRFIEADAQQCLVMLLGEANVDEVWTFFPDPWQKARHHKRRLVNPQFATDVATVLRDGGKWRLATDWRNYASQMIHVLAAHRDFDLYSCGRYPHRIATRFEMRAEREGRFPFDLTAIRRPRGY